MAKAIWLIFPQMGIGPHLQLDGQSKWGETNWQEELEGQPNFVNDTFDPWHDWARQWAAQINDQFLANSGARGRLGATSSSYGAGLSASSTPLLHLYGPPRFDDDDTCWHCHKETTRALLVLGS